MVRPDDLETRSERLEELLEEFRTKADAMSERSEITRTRAVEALKQAKATIRETERLLRRCGSRQESPPYSVHRHPTLERRLVLRIHSDSDPGTAAQTDDVRRVLSDHS